MSCRISVDSFVKSNALCGLLEPLTRYFCNLSAMGTAGDVFNSDGRLTMCLVADLSGCQNDLIQSCLKDVPIVSEKTPLLDTQGKFALAREEIGSLTWIISCAAALLTRYQHMHGKEIQQSVRQGTTSRISARRCGDQVEAGK